MSKASELHNELAPAIVMEIVTKIVRPMSMQGMSGTECLVLLESIVAGVFVAVVKLGGDTIVFDHFAERTKTRVDELRLKVTPPAGEA